MAMAKLGIDKCDAARPKATPQRAHRSNSTSGWLNAVLGCVGGYANDHATDDFRPCMKLGFSFRTYGHPSTVLAAHALIAMTAARASMESTIRSGEIINKLASGPRTNLTCGWRGTQLQKRMK